LDGRVSGSFDVSIEWNHHRILFSRGPLSANKVVKLN